MKRLLMAASLGLLAAACATDEEVAVPEAVVPAGMSTAAFLPAAASGDLLEIQSGQLALQRSCDPAVRAYAQRIIDDHTRMSNEMAATAQASGIPAPPRMLAPNHQDMLNRLSATMGPGFEAEFRNQQIAAHQEALGLLQSYAQDGEHAPLRALASSAVPIVQSHLDQAQALPMNAQCNMPTTRRPGERG